MNGHFPDSKTACSGFVKGIHAVDCKEINFGAYRFFVQCWDRGGKGHNLVFVYPMRYRTDNVREIFNAVLLHHAGQILDDVLAGQRIDQIGRADLNGRCPRKHHFDNVLGAGYAAHTHHGDGHRIGYLIHHPHRHGEDGGAGETAHLVGNNGLFGLQINSHTEKSVDKADAVCALCLARLCDGNYIGNVGNAVDNDMMTVETLFAGQLTMMVNGKAQKAWVLIKHENLDGNEMTGDDYTLRYNQYGNVTHKGWEMTLYLTVDELNKANSWAPVTATVFTCDRDAAGNIVGDWYRVGDTYNGQANVVGYRGESGGTGSFVTDNWKSYSSTYQISDDYSYRVNADVTIKTLMQTVDQSTINAFQKLLVDAEAMIANDKYAGTGIIVVEEAYRKAARFYTKNAEGKAIANNDTRRVWLIPIMKELEHVLTVAQEAIDRIEQGRQ